MKRTIPFDDIRIKILVEKEGLLYEHRITKLKILNNQLTIYARY